ncbi:MAG: hypothetical protein QXH20_02185 [Candidatus Bathyarchaeia archaeon]
MAENIREKTKKQIEELVKHWEKMGKKEKEVKEEAEKGGEGKK